MKALILIIIVLLCSCSGKLEKISPCDIDNRNPGVYITSVKLYSDLFETDIIYSSSCPGRDIHVDTSSLEAEDLQEIDSVLANSMAERQAREGLVEITFSGRVTISHGRRIFLARQVEAVSTLGMDAPLPPNVLTPSGTYSPGTDPRIIEEFERPLVDPDGA